MKVLLISDGDAKYGAANSLCQMVEQLLLKRDLDITVVLNHESSLAVYLRKHGCKVIIVHYVLYYHAYPSNVWKLLIKKVLYGIKYRYSRFSAVRELKKQINIEQIDLIHSNGTREDFGALISEKFHVPLIWHIREFGDRDYKCFSLRNDYISLMNKTAEVFIAVSDAVMEHWISKGIDKEKIVRIHNGVKTQKAPKVQNVLLKNKNEIKLVMTGSIQPTKGQIQAIELMASLKESNKKYSLDLIGDGDKQYINKLKVLIKRLGLEKFVRFLGYRNDVYELLPHYDIGLICSKSEGFGRVTAEYMMAGLPVLASNTGANGELIREGIDGCLYSYGNVQDMKNKLSLIIEESLGGEKTFRYALNNFSATVNAENIYNLYKKVLGKPDSKIQ